MNDSPKYGSPRPCATLSGRTRSSSVATPRKRFRELKEGVEGGIYLSGSGRLVRAMLAEGLVDELHLFVYPVALGAGGRLFGESERATRFELAGLERYENGIVHLGYRRADD